MSAPTKITMTFVGRRIAADETVAYAFLYRGKEHLFGAIKMVEIGFRYAGMDYGKGELKIKARPEELGEPEATKEQLREWEAKDIAAAQFGKRKTRVARAKRYPEILKPLEQIKPYLKNVTWRDRNHLADAICEILLSD